MDTRISSTKKWGWTVAQRRCLNVSLQAPTMDAKLIAVGLNQPSSSLRLCFVEANPTVYHVTNVQPCCQPFAMFDACSTQISYLFFSNKTHDPIQRQKFNSRNLWVDPTQRKLPLFDGRWLRCMLGAFHWHWRLVDIGFLLGESVCKLCNNDKVETEFNFVMECSKVQNLRNELFLL